MSWKINDKEFEAVSALPFQERYEYFIKRVADGEVVWSVRADDGWVLMGDREGRKVVPVWPHERYAAACISADWAGSEPRSIPLQEWMDSWLPGLAQDHRLIVVFRTPTSNSAVVTPGRLTEDLAEELRNYE